MSCMWKREERFTINRVCQHAASLMYRINECNEYKGFYLTLFIIFYHVCFNTMRLDSIVCLPWDGISQ